MRASLCRRSPILLLAAALVALGAFFAHSPPPAEAQAQSYDPYTYWSATLTVKEDSGEYGCSNDVGGSFSCGSATLTNNSFSYGNDFNVTDIILTSTATLNFTTSSALPSHAEELTLLIDGVPFPLSDAFSSERNLAWFNSGLSWSVGDKVRLMLVRRHTPACTTNPGNLNRSLNPRNLQVFPGDGLLTLAWDLPPTGKTYVEDMVRWRKAGTDLWLNSNGAAGNETRRGLNVTHEITGLENGQQYQVQVRQIAYDTAESYHSDTGTACIRSGWVGTTATTLLPDAAAPTELTITASGSLREGGPPTKVYFTLDHPAPWRMPASLGHAGYGWFNSEGPTFSKGATTAVMPIWVTDDSDDNNCRTLYYQVWFPGEHTWSGVAFQDEVAFTVVDDDGASDSCSGRLGSPYPTRLTLERIRIDAPTGQRYVSVHVQPKLNRPALNLRIVDVTLDIDRSTATRGRFGHSGVDFAISGAHYEGTTEHGDASIEAHQRDVDGNGRLYVHAGKTKPTYTDTLGEHDYTTEIIIDRNASANETIVLTATSGDLVASPLTLRIGSMLQQATPCTNCGTLGEPWVVTFASASHADLIEDIYEWRNDARYVHDKRHTDRWDRVLLAFGETVSDASLTAMGSSEAQGYADRGWSRWVGVAEALQDLESSGQQQEPEVEAPNRAPVTSTVGVVTIVNESGTRSFTSTSMFEDPDKDDMTVSGTSSDTSVATVSASADGSILTVSAKSRGAATITAAADDGNGGTATNTFTVRVKAAPEVASPISDVTGLTAGTSQLVSLSGVFSDADGDALSVTAAALDENVAVAEMSSDGASLTVTGVSAGETDVAVVAQDSDGNQVIASFTVSVPASQPVQLVPPEQTQQEPEPNRAPTVSSPLDDVSGLAEGATTNVALSGVFSDADGDALTITASSDNEAVATASVSTDNSTLTVSGVSSGNATITVTAQDPDGEHAAVSFDVEVTASNPQSSIDDVVSTYDTNGDGKIDRAEMAVAINDYIAGKITYAQVVEVNKAYQSS